MEQQHQNSVARGLARGMQRGVGLDLRTQVGRGVDEEPMISVCGNGDGRLSAGGNASRPRGLAIGARAIPLRQADTSAGAENASANG